MKIIAILFAVTVLWAGCGRDSYDQTKSYQTLRGSGRPEAGRSSQSDMGASGGTMNSNAGGTGTNANGTAVGTNAGSGASQGGQGSGTSSR